MNTTQTAELQASVLVKEQKKTYGPKYYTENGRHYRITAKVRYDDQCGNGHNSFSVTAEIDSKWALLDNLKEYGQWRDYSGGCCHEEIAKHFPELAPFIKWHLMSSYGPMHYIANTVYHATQHGPTSAWVYFEDEANGIAKACMKYFDLPDAERICKTAGYSMVVDEKTAKVANLEHARATAIWPEATQEQLLDKDALLARLPALVAEFKAAVESLGFVY